MEFCLKLMLIVRPDGMDAKGELGDDIVHETDGAFSSTF